MRVLVAVPFKRGKGYRLSLDSIHRLEWDGRQIDRLFLVDGDDDENSYINITRKSREARRMALAGGYDAMLMTETDIILPSDAVKRLAKVDSDVAYGLFVHPHAFHTWSATVEFIDNKYADSVSLHPDLARKSWGKVIKVVGVGASCLFIRRHVLEALDFRLDSADEGRCADWWFAVDCEEMGFIQKCDTRVICGQIDMGIKSPRILWPDITRKGFYRSDISVGVNDEGQSA